MNGEKLSGCLIVKNEGKALEKCLESIAPILDELIIVDTGSSDDTVEIAKKYTDKIFFYEWNHHFAEARNFAISKATSEWIIFPDADEYFSPQSLKEIEKTIREEGMDTDALMISGFNISTETNQINDKFSVVRIFRNKPELRYTGRIHEFLQKKGNYRILDCTDSIEFFHTGYNKDVVDSKDKNQRNILLLEEDLKENPNNGNAHFYLSQQYVGMQDYEKVLYHSEQAIKNGLTVLGREPNAYINFVHANVILKRKSHVELIRICEDCLRKHPNHPDIYLLMTELVLKDNKIEQGVQLLEDFLAKSDWNNNFKYVTNLNEDVYARIYGLLGDLYLHSLHDVHKAVSNYMKLLKIDVLNEVAFQKLASVLLKYESENNVSTFFNQIYNLQDINHLYFLAIQLAKLGKTQLVEGYKKRLIEIAG